MDAVNEQKKKEEKGEQSVQLTQTIIPPSLPLPPSLSLSLSLYLSLYLSLCRRSEYVPCPTTAAVSLLKGLAMVLTYLFRDTHKFADDYRSGYPEFTDLG